MAMKKFKTKHDCKNWLNEQVSQTKWIATLKEGYFGITVGGCEK